MGSNDKHADLTCRDVAEFLMRYDDNELSAEQRREFETHLSICPPCVAYLDSYRRTAKLAGASKDGVQAPPIPDALVKAIVSARTRPLD